MFQDEDSIMMEQAAFTRRYFSLVSLNIASSLGQDARGNRVKI